MNELGGDVDVVDLAEPLLHDDRALSKRDELGGEDVFQHLDGVAEALVRDAELVERRHVAHRDGAMRDDPVLCAPNCATGELRRVQVA
jgi:hypothetical protein